jgi:biopolymer transport protein ExbB
MGRVGYFSMTLGQLLAQGGLAMWPIYLCSVVALVVFAQRLLLYRTIRPSRLLWLDQMLELLHQRDWRSAIKLCRTEDHPVARVFLGSLKMLNHRPDRVTSEAERLGNRELEYLERYLSLLGFIAQVAPLLGLLGTVLGMVKMFLELQSGGMSNLDASALASGIWQALLTTAAGLIVAAPTLAGYLYLSSRIDRFRHQLRDAVTQFLSAIPHTASDLSIAPDTPDANTSQTPQTNALMPKANTDPSISDV